MSVILKTVFLSLVAGLVFASASFSAPVEDGKKVEEQSKELNDRQP